MSIMHLAEIYTEMLNNPDFHSRVASEAKDAFVGWDLTDGERKLLLKEAKSKTTGFKPAENLVLNYLVRNQPLDEAVGLALGNAIGRKLGLPVIGPRAAGCDGGCCSWTSRILFGANEYERI